MTGPGSRMLFCWLLQNQPIWKHMWSLWIVQLERGTRAFAVETFPADFYQNLNNASSSPKPQCFLRCPARIQSISTLPGGPQSWEIPSVLLLPPHHCGTTSPERFLLKALEKRTSVLKAEISVHGEYPGWECGKKHGGSERLEGMSEQKANVEFSSCHRREAIWGHPR